MLYVVSRRFITRGKQGRSTNVRRKDLRNALDLWLNAPQDSWEIFRMGIQVNQHNARNRAHLAGFIAAEGAGWLLLSAGLDATVKSIAMTPKRAAGGLFLGGIPFS